MFHRNQPDDAFLVNRNALQSLVQLYPLHFGVVADVHGVNIGLGKGVVNLAVVRNGTKGFAVGRVNRKRLIIRINVLYQFFLAALVFYEQGG